MTAPGSGDSVCPVWQSLVEQRGLFFVGVTMLMLRWRGSKPLFAGQQGSKRGKRFRLRVPPANWLRGLTG
jgi:hypothetical protein